MIFIPLTEIYKISLYSFRASNIKLFYRCENFSVRSWFFFKKKRGNLTNGFRPMENVYTLKIGFWLWNWEGSRANGYEPGKMFLLTYKSTYFYGIIQFYTGMQQLRRADGVGRTFILFRGSKVRIYIYTYLYCALAYVSRTYYRGKRTPASKYNPYALVNLPCLFYRTATLLLTQFLAL